jgi:oxygen-independent coproporphyrinogen-3 oxidase
VHVPFCAHHCCYCDFAVAVGQDDRIDEYIRALEAELSRLGEPQPVRTLFLGGGTPTHLSAHQLESLLVMLRRWLILEPDYEYSIEANPAGLTDEKIGVLAGHGVNRVSLGAQSFDAALLRVLERDHKPTHIARTVNRVRRLIENVSIDLIFGVPGQDIEHWNDDLNRAVALQLSHISTYGLTYEKGTRLWKQRRDGVIRPVDEETELAMYKSAMVRLGVAGFEHYEISNHAWHGFECRHNHVYWANEACFGFGVGAASYVQGVRRLNTRDLRTYIKRALAGEPTHFQSEELPPRERALETAVVQLRRSAGIERTSFQAQTGFALKEIVGSVNDHLAELGLLVSDDRGVRLTAQGKCVADAVIQEVMKGVADPLRFGAE